MLRKETRRRARRRLIQTRIIAGVTAIAIGLGLAVGGTVAATAAGGPSSNTNSEAHWQQLPGEVCVKPSFSSENSTTTPFTLPALDAAYTYSKVIVKAGSTGSSVTNENTVYTQDRQGGALTAGDTFVHAEKNSISHVIYCYVPAPVPEMGNDLTCDVATNYPGRALSNGDHINMRVIQNGAQVPVSAYIDIRQSQDPASESGLVVRVTAPGGPYTLPLTNAERASGTFAFSYASYLTGAFTVEWVQFNSTYFNKDGDRTQFLVCGDLTTEELVTPTARMVDLTCDTAGSYTLDDVEGIRWFIGNTEVQPGTYPVTTAQTVVVRAEAIAPDYGLEPDAPSTFTFVFTEPDDCELPCLPASAVSYTYYTLMNATASNPLNSGLITVTARPGYSTELCDDFWVVAASWNYTSATSIWPQTLRSTDPAGDHPQGYVGGVGTYFFHAPLACGQGDVYASFTGMPYVGPELFGPNNPFTERFLHQMGFRGPNPTWIQTAPGCNVTSPIAPTATAIVECGTDGSIDISDVANPYVGYTVYRGAAVNGSVAGLETVNLAEATEGVFTVVATPLGGYVFPKDTITQWEFNLGERFECPVDVNLTLTYMEECAPDSTYTFRVRNAQDYSVPYTFTVAGNPQLNGSGIAAPGDTFFDLDLPRTNPAQSYTVTLKWGDGTTIIAEQTTKASGRDKVCALTVDPVVDITCAAPGSYTVPNVPGVSWSIAGEPVAPGTYSATDAGTLTLRATATSGHVLYLDGQLSSARDFSLTFTEPGPCADPTFNGATSTASECVRDVPWINYSVVVDDPDSQLTSTAARLIFVDPLDATRTHEIALGTVTPGVPLSGRVLWPGASVDAAGNPTGWPGWTQASDGTWIETAYEDNFRWTRGITEVTLQVNPSMQIAVSYPPPSALCVTGPREIAPLATEATCVTDGKVGYELPPITGVTWFVNGAETASGFHPVSAATTVDITFTIDEAHPDGPFGLKADAPRSFSFAFTAEELVCELTTEPITNATIGFLAATCDLGQQLDPSRFVVEDPTLARYAPELSDLVGPDYAVVFVVTDPDAVFYGSSNAEAGRTLSDGGKTLTFSGTLAGPDRGTDCVTTVELKDPVSFIDSCLGASFTVYYVKGIVYTVYRNDDAPFVIEWAEGELTRTYVAEQGESVRIIPSAESDRYTISPDPAPFERTFATYEGDCLPTLPLVEGSATFTPATCLDTTNWVTLADVEGVQWWVNGTQASHGTWPMSTGETVVTATPLPGYGFGPEATTRWEFEGVAVGDDCLPTLAITGASTASLGLGGAALLMLLMGAGLLAFRRRQHD